MDVFWDINDIFPQRKSAVTVGTFDGVHLGHRRIVNTLIARAKEKAALSTLVTFEPHPQLVLNKKKTTGAKLLSTVDEKIELLQELGLDRLVVTNFTAAFAAMSAQEFVKDHLKKKLGMTSIVLGHDHAFGKGREGNVELLQRLGAAFDFTVLEVSPVEDGEKIISSTEVRRALTDGRVDVANRYLGRRYALSGRVVNGDGRGRQLGTPTANIRLFSQYKLVPKAGIYATQTMFDRQIYNSVTYIGRRPTFHLKQKVVETHIFDFDADLYDKEVTLYFCDFLRDDAQFDSDEQLANQIERDKKHAIEYLKINC